MTAKSFPIIRNDRKIISCRAPPDSSIDLPEKEDFLEKFDFLKFLFIY